MRLHFRDYNFSSSYGVFFVQSKFTKQRQWMLVHPWRLTWNIIMEVWKIIFLSKWVICRFHVNLPGCNMFHLWFTPDWVVSWCFSPACLSINQYDSLKIARISTLKGKFWVPLGGYQTAVCSPNITPYCPIEPLYNPYAAGKCVYISRLLVPNFSLWNTARESKSAGLDGSSEANAFLRRWVER